jgi:hypothetical protein
VLPAVAVTKEVAMIERKALSKEDIDHHAYELSVRCGTDSGKGSPLSWDHLIGRALDKLSGAENALRYAVLFAFNPKFNDVLAEAHTSIRRAIATLTEAHTIRREPEQT